MRRRHLSDLHLKKQADLKTHFKNGKSREIAKVADSTSKRTKISTIAKEENSPVADTFLILRQKKTYVVKQQKKNAVKV